MGRTRDDKLTDRQRRFVEHYATSFNGREAAIKAGYSQRTATEIASENLTKPHIRAEIARLGQRTADELGITRGYVLSRLATVVERAIEGIPKFTSKGEPLLDAEGHQVMVQDSAGANRALELLMKHRGELVDRSALEASGGVSVTINAVDIEDLR